MRLLSLTLEHFRSYPSLSIDLRGANRHLFLGRNGSGKTNLLEAIGFLSLTKSLRGREDEELVRWSAEHFRVTGECCDHAQQSLTLEVVSVLTPRRRKAAFRNGVRTQPAALVGIMPTVSFLPQDLLLFSGPPAERRRFLDQLLCQLSGEFLTLSFGYRKALHQRNALLRCIAKGTGTGDDLDVWDREVAHRGSAITLARLELIEMLNLTFARELQNLGERWEDVRLHYERRGTEREQCGMEQELRSLLRENRERDLILQSTTVGPHREDWQVFVSGRALPTWASRGQERTAVIALLLLEVSYLELRRGERPLLLLDDVFSELDDAHQEALLGSLADHQVFLTSTRVPAGLRDAKVWEVREGACVPVVQPKAAMVQ